MLLVVRILVGAVLITPLIVNAPYFGSSGLLPHTFFPFIVGKALFSRSLIEIAFGLWVVLAIRSPEYRVPRSWIIAVIGAYLLVALAASLTGVSSQRSLWSTYERMQGFVDLAHWMAFVLVVAAVFKTAASWRGLLNVNLAIAFTMSILGLGELAGYSPLSFINPAGKLHITLGNSTYVGAYHLVGVLIAMGFLVQSYQPQREEPSRATGRRRRRRAKPVNQTEFPINLYLMRMFWIAVIVLGVVMVLQSGTRGALIGLGSGFLAFAIAYTLWGRDRNLKRASMVVIGGLVLLGFTLALARNTEAFQNVVKDIPALHRLSTISLTEGSFAHRIETGIIGLRGFAERPLLGWGPENFTIAYDRLVTGDVVIQQTQSFDQAHNKVIEELTTKGILGLVAYMGIWLLMLRAFVRRVQSESAHSQILTMFVGAALVGYFVQNLALFDTPGTVSQFMLLLAFAIYLDTSPGEEFDAVAAEPNDADGRTGRSAFIERGGRVFAFALQPLKPSIPQRGVEATADSPFLLPLQLATAIVLVLTAVWIWNLRAYDASRTILDTMNPSLAWSGRLDAFQQTVDKFPQLGNYPRLVLYIQLTRSWSGMTQEERQLAVNVVVDLQASGFEEEPDEWRLYATLASFYQVAGGQLVPLARDLVNEVIRLAPERQETVQLVVAQEVAEGDFDGAFQILDAYIALYPGAGDSLRSLRDRVSSASSSAGGS